jgi:hypothetical protein
LNYRLKYNKFEVENMKKAKVIIIAVVLVIYGIIIFAASPNFNPLYSDGLSFYALIISSFVVVLWIIRGLDSINPVIVSDIHGRKRMDKIGLPKMGRTYIIIAIAPWAILILVNIFSSVVFNSGRYYKQMATPEKRTFTSDVQAIDITQVPIVDKSFAALLADKMLGEKPDLGSQVTLGDPTIQKVNNKLVWIVPLEHSGFFKWLANTAGTPGYIVVSATDPRDVTYVSKYPIKYQPNAYFLDNLSRHVRFDGGLFTGITDYSFEINDDGVPYWVVTTYKNKAGFSLPEADGVLIVDAATGAETRYSINDIPKWVDRVQPEEYIAAQLNNQGQYVHGIFNFSNKDKYQTSDNHAIIYNAGRCYYFTVLTSVGSDESSIGFMLVDMVTKKPYLYQISGATESAAQQSAQGKVQNLRYNASYPLITNVNGVASYFMTLKDDAGLVKQYAFVSVKDITTVGTGDTVQNALDNYNSYLNNRSGSSSIDTSGKKLVVAGTVSRIASEINNGDTIYKLILTEQPDKIFTAVSNISNMLALTKEGDKVSITYIDTTNKVIEISKFDNTTISQAGK